jgi:CheY-like chemotaxis protein
MAPTFPPDCLPVPDEAGDEGCPETAGDRTIGSSNSWVAKGGGAVKKSILVVDDEFDIVDALSSLLEYEGFRVHCAADGAEGLTQLERHQPDLLIVDLMMPNVDGLQVIRTVREHPELRGTPIILISALRPPAHADERSRGWSAYLRKPFSIEELLAAIERVRDGGQSGEGMREGELSS